MVHELYTILTDLKFPVYRQGSFTEDQEFPESFFTYWNNDSWDGSHYDNDAVRWTWSFDVNFYSSDPSKIQKALDDAKKELKKNGWIVSGKGRDLPSGKESHTGRGFSAYFIEIRRNE